MLQEYKEEEIDLYEQMVWKVRVKGSYTIQILSWLVQEASSSKA